VIEPDFISTKDGVLIARHDPNLATSTDVASRPEFADLKRVDWPVDGEKQNRLVRPRFHPGGDQDAGRGDHGPRAASREQREIQGRDDAGDFRPGQKRKAQNLGVRSTSTLRPRTRPIIATLAPLEDKLIAALNAEGWNSRSAPVFVQSFEPSSLKEMRSKGLKTRMVQLVDGDDIDLKTGKITYAIPFDRPYDWRKSGDERLFGDMVTPAGLAEIRTYADGIGVWKPYIVPVKGRMGRAGQLVDVNGDGKVDLQDATTKPPTALVAEAHKRGLFVHVFTFRNESGVWLPTTRVIRRLSTCSFFRLGVDGVFSEFPDTAVMARAIYLRECGR